MNRLRLAAALVGTASLAAALAAPVLAATPKAGAACTRSQSGKVSGTLVCAKSGSSYKWVKRTTSTTKKSTTAATPAPTSQSPSQVDLVSIMFGAPATATAKIDIACTGTFASGGNEAKSASFGAAGGSSQTTLSLVEPGTANPTGSSCTATATIGGATPTALQLLVNGRTQAGPVAAPTLSAPAFTAPGPFVVTAIVQFGGGSGAPAAGTVASTTTAPVAGTATTIAGAATTTTLATGTTTPPPASGRPEVRNVFLGTLPSTLTGVDIKVTCTPAPGTTGFQIQSARLGLVASSAALPLTLAPASGTTSGTQCQAEAGLVGTVDTSQVTARVLLNGQPISGPTFGNFINSPAFPAPQAFTITAEFTFPGATTASTTTSTTIAGSTSTVVVGAGGTTTTTTPVVASVSSIAVAPAGVVPAGVAGYRVELTCTNVVSGGTVLPTLTYTSLFGTGQSSVNYSFAPTTATTCSINAVSTGATPNVGTMTVLVNGVARGSGTAGSASVASFAQTTPIQVRVTIQY